MRDCSEKARQGLRPEVYLTKTLQTSCRELREVPQAALAFSTRFSLLVCRLMNW
jgi:hypothetical protein